MSFFHWLREGVRQAVVLGLADAVDDVGNRTSGEDLGPALAQSLRDRLSVDRGQRVLESSVVEPKTASSTGGRRRLGRSFEGARETVRKAA